MCVCVCVSVSVSDSADLVWVMSGATVSLLSVSLDYHTNTECQDVNVVVTLVICLHLSVCTPPNRFSETLLTGNSLSESATTPLLSG